MPNLPGTLAMIESDVPPAERWREKSREKSPGHLAGPQRDGADSPFPPRPLGGGSCIDAAKGVAILSGNGGQILGYEGVDKVARPVRPARTTLTDTCLATNPREASAGHIEALFRAAP